MTRSLLAAVALGLGVFLASAVDAYAQARDFSSLYDDAVLREVAPRYRDWIVSNFENVFLPKLTTEERQRVQGVSVQVPPRGNERGLFEFYSISGTKTIVMPAQSIRFVYDISVAYAWLQTNGYTIETVSDYISMLKYQDVSRFAGRFPDPRRALGIPEHAEDDKRVEGSIQQTFNQSIMFILLHELGHVLYRHPGYASNVPRADAQAHEDEADRFALEVLRRGGQPAIGVFFLYAAFADSVPNRADFHSDADYKAFLACATHPLTSDRMRHMSAFIREHAADFSRLQDNPANVAQLHRWIADGFDRDVMPALEDVGVLRITAAHGRSMTLAGLQPRRPGEILAAPKRAVPTQPFDGVYDGKISDSSAANPIRAVLQRRGDHVTGFYSYGVSIGRLDGSVEGTLLTFTWREPGRNGSGLMRITADGAQFAGTWGRGDETTGGGGWTGRRSRR
jgi:hypothetical protein